MGTSNSINANNTGLVRYNGTGTFDSVTTTNHNILLGAASNGITSLAPSSTTGAPLISAGAAADPGFSTTFSVNDASFFALEQASNAGGLVQISLVNTEGANASSAARYTVGTGGTAAGDSYVFFNNGSNAKIWEIGAQNSSNNFLITNNIPNASTANMSGTTLFQIANTGAITIPSGGSLTFGSGTALSTYVQGTFTPVLNFGGASVGIVYVVQDGKYTQIGNIVFYQITIQISNKGSSVGTAQISGLPVAAYSSGSLSRAYCEIQSITLTASYTSAFFNPNNSATTGFFSQQGSGQTLAVLTDTNFANGCAIAVTGYYFTA